MKNIKFKTKYKLIYNYKHYPNNLRLPNLNKKRVTK